MFYDTLSRYNRNFYIWCIGIVLISISIFHSFDLWGSILFIIGLIVISTSLFVFKIWKSGGASMEGEISKKMERKPTVSEIIFIAGGIALMIVALMDNLQVIELVMFGLGISLLVHALR